VGNGRRESVPGGGGPDHGQPIRHGIFLAPFHPLEENPTLCLERDLELVQLLDRLGFAEAWVGEHHSAGFETIDSPEIFIAAAAERTRHIRLGTGVVSLPYHHPLNVANRIVQLDHMTRGRVMFGVGPGLLASDALMMGIAPEDTRERMAQSLDAIVRLLNGEVVNEKTDWYTLRDARTHLRPFTRPHPEICVASSVTPSGGRLAGRYGLGMLCVAAGERAGFDALATNWAVAEQVAAEHGQVMDRSRLRVVLIMHLAESRERAREDIRYGCKKFVDYFNNNLPRWPVPEGTDPVDWVIENELAVVGTPDDALARIERVRERQGGIGAVLLQANNWAPWPETQHSYELYARYVMPALDGANVNRADSYQWVTANQAELIETRTRAADQMFERHRAEEAARAASRPEGRPTGES
jgi:limonene 1,2-monooxygenase